MLWFFKDVEAYSTTFFRYSGGTSVDMKTLSHDHKYIEYNEQLYKKLLPTFKRVIPADIMHEHVISERLTTSEMVRYCIYMYICVCM